MGWMKYVLAVFLSLSLLSLSMVKSQIVGTCPINTDELSPCGSLVEAALNSPLPPTPSSSCCSPLQGLNLDQADSCVTTAIASGVIVLPASLPPVLDFPLTIILTACNFFSSTANA
ncbi:pEARLI1-like lipid transfer protein 1 [Vigna radiata var. radiata]|uniref:PEARLI1-like lipid transfer protein 1 n=1 Tax=Vigna radiata var. radiata TaxID=3916 RepID=A0A1S3TZ21_VIGRR|nr:pEARLI1-like lipid transfer protein 1 [Vigna radiata var. radiata]